MHFSMTHLMLHSLCQFFHLLLCGGDPGSSRKVMCWEQRVGRKTCSQLVKFSVLSVVHQIMYSSKPESIIAIRKLFYLVSFISKLKMAHEWMLSGCVLQKLIKSSQLLFSVAMEKQNSIKGMSQLSLEVYVPWKFQVTECHSMAIV